MLIISTLLLITNKAIEDHKYWARIGGIIFGAILLIGFPILTALGIYILWGLIKGWDTTEPTQEIAVTNTGGAINSITCIVAATIGLFCMKYLRQVVKCCYNNRREGLKENHAYYNLSKNTVLLYFHFFCV
jgi:hypothetical protein